MASHRLHKWKEGSQRQSLLFFSPIFLMREMRLCVFLFCCFYFFLSFLIIPEISSEGPSRERRNQNSWRSKSEEAGRKCSEKKRKREVGKEVKN